MVGGEDLSVPSPKPVVCCSLPDRVAPVFAHVVSPPLGWSPLSYFLVIWYRWMRLICPAQDHVICLTLLIISTRCSMRETRETAQLHVVCGNPARRRYCMGAKFSCISSLHAYSYIQQSGVCKNYECQKY